MIYDNIVERTFYYKLVIILNLQNITKNRKFANTKVYTIINVLHVDIEKLKMNILRHIKINNDKSLYICSC